jgi:holo-[acyl-carrier protein] synthase
MLHRGLVPVKGIGIDIVDIERIARLLQRHGRHFTDKVFTERERVYCEKLARPAVHMAGRFAVKEAFYKALPESCQEASGWKSIETVTEPFMTRPQVVVVDDRLKQALQEAGIGSVQVSISHERSMAVAMVLLGE